MLDRGQHYNSKKLAVVAIAIAMLAFAVSNSGMLRGSGGSPGNVTVYNNYTNNTNASYYNVTSNLTNATVDFHNGNASNLSQPINVSVLPFDTCTGSPLQWSWWDGTRLNCYTYSDDDTAYMTIAAYNIDFNNLLLNNSEQEVEIKAIRSNESNYITNSTMDKNYNNLTNIPVNFNNSSMVTINQTIRPYTVDYNNLTNVPTNFNNSTVGSKETTWDAKVDISVSNLTNYYNKTTSDLLYASSALTYYFWNTSATASNFTGYTVMNTTLPNITVMKITSFASVVDGTNIIKRVNENTNITAMESGLWAQHTHTMITAGTKNLQLRSELYLNGSNFTDLLISSSSTSNIVPNDGMMHDIIWSGQIQQKIFMNSTDRLVMKLYAVVTGAGVDPSFEIHVEGNTSASIILPVNQQSIVVQNIAAYNASYETWSNKSTNTALGTSDLLYPSQNAVKIYADYKEPLITNSTNNVFLNGLKNWITLAIGNITSLQGILDAMNTTDTNLSLNDTNDRAYVNNTFIKLANAPACNPVTQKSVSNGSGFTCETDQTGAGGSPTAEATYRYNSGGTTMLSNATIMDVFNAVGSGKVIRITEIKAYVNDTAAVTGIFAPVEITKTSTVGTGGTVISAGLFDSTDAALPAQITARTAPSGGAAFSGNNLSGTRINTEEGSISTGALSSFPWLGSEVNLYINSGITPRQRITLAEGEGIRCSWGNVIGVAAGLASCIVEFQVGSAYANELPTYSWLTSTNAAANKYMMDIFNAVGSGKVLKITRITIYSVPNAAVTGQVIPFTVYRTTTNGTGGTVIVADRYNTSNPIVAGSVTARTAPSGGAALSGGGIISMIIGTDETAYSEFGGFDMIARGSNTQYIWDSTTTQRPLTVRAGEGIVIRTAGLADSANVKIIVEGTIV